MSWYSDLEKQKGEVVKNTIKLNNVWGSEKESKTFKNIPYLKWSRNEDISTR